MAEIPSYLSDLSDNWNISCAQKESVLRTFIKEHPENEPMILHYLKLNLCMQEKYDECIAVCHRLLQMEDADNLRDDHLFTIAKCYEHKGDYDKAIAAYGVCIEQDPHCEESILCLCDIYLERRDWEKALHTYDLLQVIGDDSAKCEELHGKGWVYLEKKELDTALGYFKEGMELFPKQPCFPHGIGMVYVEQKKWDTALEWFSKALEVEPQSAEAHYGMGLCRQMTDDFYRAMHHYTEALKIKPDFPEVYNNIAGLSLKHEGNVQKAIELLKKAVETAADEKQRMSLYFGLNRLYRLISDYHNSDYYKEKWMRSLGFDVKYEDGDEGEEE